MRKKKYDRFVLQNDFFMSFKNRILYGKQKNYKL